MVRLLVEHGACPKWEREWILCKSDQIYMGHHQGVCSGRTFWSIHWEKLRQAVLREVAHLDEHSLA